MAVSQKRKMIRDSYAKRGLKHPYYTTRLDQEIVAIGGSRSSPLCVFEHFSSSKRGSSRETPAIKDPAPSYSKYEKRNSRVGLHGNSCTMVPVNPGGITANGALNNSVRNVEGHFWE